jgi:hypothetical protein
MNIKTKILLLFIGCFWVQYGCSLSNECYSSNSIKLFKDLYQCYECSNNEIKKIVALGKQNLCIYETLNVNLQTGPVSSIQEKEKIFIKGVYKEIHLSGDSLIKKYNFKATEEEIVRIYLSDQKAAYQIRSIEPMFQIDKNKTLLIIKDFIVKANNNPNYARKDVVDYAQARLTYYQSQK